jgi:hypothetical protein
MLVSYAACSLTLMRGTCSSEYHLIYKGLYGFMFQSIGNFVTIAVWTSNLRHRGCVGISSSARNRIVCEDFILNFGCCIPMCLTLPFSPEGICRKSTLLSFSTHSTFLYFPNLKCNWKAAIWTQIRYQGRIAGGAEHLHRTRLPGCI